MSKVQSRFPGIDDRSVTEMFKDQINSLETINMQDIEKGTMQNIEAMQNLVRNFGSNGQLYEYMAEHESFAQRFKQSIVNDSIYKKKKWNACRWSIWG